MNVLIFGGTTEGRLLAQRTSQMGIATTVSVATPLGVEELQGHEGFGVLVGRMDQSAMERALQGFDACVDATHPYAVEATATIACACATTGTPLLRLVRDDSHVEGCIMVGSAAEAAEFLSHTQGNILLATGAKELAAYKDIDPQRLFARILPTHMGLDACEELGLPHRNILALQGPFSRAMNQAMIEQYDIAWMVTKDGGAAGGFDDKLQATRQAGANLVVIRRPEETGLGFDDVVQRLEAMLDERSE